MLFIVCYKQIIEAKDFIHNKFVQMDGLYICVLYQKFATNENNGRRRREEEREIEIHVVNVATTAAATATMSQNNEWKSSQTTFRKW